MDTVKLIITTEVVNEPSGTLHHKVTQEYPNVAKADLPALQRAMAELWLGLGEAAAKKHARS